jgi:Tol biopolymer transport system component/dienelactone hydrolase
MHTSRLILLIVVAAAVLAACGGAPAPQSSGSATTAPVAIGGAPIAATSPTLTTAPAASATDTVFDYDPKAALDIQEVGAGQHDAGFTTHDVSFASSKGGRVPAYLVVPDGPGPFAGLLLMPGSGGIRGGPLLRYAQDLAKTGVVSLLMDGPEARFPHDGPLFRWTEEDREIIVQYVVDLRRGVDLLTARPEVDPKRLGYIGIGFSGAMGGVLAGVDKRIKAYVLNAAPANYVTEIMAPSHPLYAALHEVPQAQQQRWAAAYDPVQPDHYIGRAAPAALFFQPVVHDTFTTKAESERLYQAASAPKQITWYDATRDTSLNAETIRDQLAWFKTELGIAADTFDGKTLGIGGSLASPTTAAVAAAATTAPSSATELPTSTSSAKIQFLGHTGEIKGVAFSPDSKYLATSASDHTARLWDVATGKQLHVFAQPDALETVEFSPDGKYLLTAGLDHKAWLWDVATGQTVHVFSGHTGITNDAEFAPDGKSIITAGDDDGTARVWDVVTGKIVRTINQPPVVIGAAFSPDGKYIVTTSIANEARLWDAATGQQLRIFPSGTIFFSPDGKYLLAGGADHTAKLLDVATGQAARSITGFPDAVDSVAFSPDGKYLLTGSDDQIARLFDVASGQTVQIFTGHTGAVWHVAFSPDGKWLATASLDGTAKLWPIPVAR